MARRGRGIAADIAFQDHRNPRSASSGVGVDCAPTARSHKDAMAEASYATRDYRRMKARHIRYRDRRET